MHTEPTNQLAPPVETTPRKIGAKEGVHYAPQDYAGIGPRAAILVIDSLVIFFILAFLAGICGLVPWIFRFYGVAALLVIWLYEVPLKRSSWRTVGYWLLGYKIVTLQGQRPSLFALTFRAMLWMFGPLAMVFDILWCGMEVDRQSMRDCFACTYVVKSRAEPIGIGSIVYTRYFLMGYNLMYPRVKRPDAIPAVAPDR